MRWVMRSKIHKAIVTQADLNYVGSITIDQNLLDAAGLWPGEKVLVVSNTSGARLETYTIAGERGHGDVCVNGAAARLVHAGDRVTGFGFATRSEVIAQHGMAATSQPLATQVALDVLKQGGSAVDAAIAANAALGLMEPTGCGIGGDLFAIVWDGTAKRLHGLNASGRSPRALSLAYFREQGLERIPERGPLPVSVPGAVDG